MIRITYHYLEIIHMGTNVIITGFVLAEMHPYVIVIVNEWNPRERKKSAKCPQKA